MRCGEHRKPDRDCLGILAHVLHARTSPVPRLLTVVRDLLRGREKTRVPEAEPGDALRHISTGSAFIIELREDDRQRAAAIAVTLYATASPSTSSPRNPPDWCAQSDA